MDRCRETGNSLGRLSLPPSLTRPDTTMLARLLVPGALLLLKLLLLLSKVLPPSPLLIRVLLFFLSLLLKITAAAISNYFKLYS